jgi:mannose-6-phosphate isomerase-like protein (cupin superfamily)
MNAYRVRFVQAVRKPRMHEHVGAEFLYVLSGRLGVTVAGEEHILDEGDSIYFDSSQPHSYRRLDARAAEAIVVTVPA